MIKKENKTLNLLVVEDNPGDQLLLKKYLQRSKIAIENIYCTERLAQVENILQQHEIDLAFVDLTLPDSSGLDSFSSLQKLLPYTPIIVLSGLSDVEAATDTIALGAQDYLMKGEFDERLLLKSIQYSIERKKTQVKLEESNKRLEEIKERYEIVNTATKDMIWDWDIVNNKVLVNTKMQETYGYMDKDISLEWFLEKIHPEDKENLKYNLFQALENRIKYWESEFRLLASDGSFKYAFARGYILFDVTGKAYRMIGATTDITERKKMEKELLAQQLNQQKVITETTIQAQEKQREELAKELHDNINQVLATVKMFLDIAKEDKKRHDLVFRSYENVNYVIEEIRKLSKSLVAPSLGDMGLLEAFQDLAEEVNLTKGLNVTLDLKKHQQKILEPGIELMLYRIAQEQLNNIIKYAKATRAVINLKSDSTSLFLSISDNGIGFDPSLKARGIGLKNIASRIEFYSGKLEIITAPGKGCTLHINIPL